MSVWYLVMFTVAFLLVPLAVLQTIAPAHVASRRSEKNSSHLATSPARTVTNGELSCSYVNSSSCLFGFYCANSTCQCRSAPEGIVDCSKDGIYNFAVLNCYCATFDSSKNRVDLGASAWSCGSNQLLNVGDVVGMYKHFKNIPANYNMCVFLGRTGEVCGRCLPNHYPLAYSFSFACAQCHHVRWNWVRYIMAAYLPLTIFCLVILFCKINIVSSHLHPVVFFSQGMAMPPFARIVLLFLSNKRSQLETTFKTILSLYGVWNLDFFRPFYSDLCLGIGVLPTLALDYAIAVYPLLLIIVSYLLIVLYDRNYRIITIMWRPFRVLFSLFKRNWDVRTSVVDAFSAFFLLSNIKFLSASFDLLVPTRVYHLYGDTYNYTLGLYYAGDIEYFGSEHLPYAILAIAVLCVFVILPIVLLALYPFKFFQKFLNLFPTHWFILHTFVDSFQGCYKDGTEPGTRDCRWFSAVYLALRCICFIVYGLTLNGNYFSLCSMFILLFIVCLIGFQPYKNRVALQFKSNTIILVLYVTFYNVVMSIERASIKYEKDYLTALFPVALILALLPPFCILGLILRWAIMKGRFHFGLLNRLRWWRRGYLAVGDDGDAADAYSDRVVNPQAYYHSAPCRHLVYCPSQEVAGDKGIKTHSKP